MPTRTPAAVRKQIAEGTPDPIYLIVGDDTTETHRLADELSGLVEEEIRAFNVERLYATDKSVSGGAIVEAARHLPMMSNRRVVVVLRAEKLLKPKRQSKADDISNEEDAAPAGGETELLEAYVRQRNRSRRWCLSRPTSIEAGGSTKRFRNRQRSGVLGAQARQDARVDLRLVARQAAQMVQQAVAKQARRSMRLQSG
jgi:hypothetical protein